MISPGWRKRANDGPKQKHAGAVSWRWNDGHWWTHTALATALIRCRIRGDEAAAILRYRPRHVFRMRTRPWHDRGRLAEARRQWIEAEAWRWRGFLAVDDSPWWAHTALAAALNEQGRGGEAETILARRRVTFSGRKPSLARPWPVGGGAPAVDRGRCGCWRRFLALDDSPWWAPTPRWPRHSTRRAAARRRRRSYALRQHTFSGRNPSCSTISPDWRMRHLGGGPWRKRAGAVTWRCMTVHGGPSDALAGALREQRYLDEAETVLAVLPRIDFPDQRPPWRRTTPKSRRRGGSWAGGGMTLGQCPNPRVQRTGPRIVWVCARLTTHRRRLGEAEAALRSAALQFPNESEVWSELVRAAEVDHRWAEAERHLAALPGTDRSGLDRRPGSGDPAAATATLGTRLKRFWSLLRKGFPDESAGSSRRSMP